MLPQIKLQSQTGNATITEHGSQVQSWQTADGQEQLYVSPRAVMDGQAAIRGGVPLCFPQFNMRVLGTKPLPKHGFARNMPWALVSQDEQSVRMELASNEATLAIWPHAFRAGLDVRLEQNSLRVSFDVVNSGQEVFSFALALHTYFHVNDIHDTSLNGLEGCAYWDAVKDPHQPLARSKDTAALRFGTETDRVYANAPRELRLQDGARVRRITHSESLPDTVVWNPGQSLCAQLKDMPAQGWRQMLCVEAACIEQPVHLSANQRWQGWQQIELMA
ncbi:D-hexose-6-phosphate mutarotase [Variovorax sp. PCZ-1]|uniref:D-hexose-6-phosphate mutarotase n=1 Tax=Variovorax sp. PCZ-1 TaxID=2835533 RepID=UPI001BCAE344|nr:D-hexose-6-phosphate mutarotase [Variovorax sp. PCZ-1]MBS7806225.1 D-hexose-6-phosphate mutarotase [Variovorax sp. PCZ-1]